MLIVATGATHAYFGHDDWEPFAPGLKTLKDAVRIRRRILVAFERAEAEPRRCETRAAWLSFAIVGGGPTGVELAGTMAEIARHTLRREFRHIDPASAKVRLLEAGPRVLSTFPESLSEKARKQLVRLGVEVVTGKAVTDISSDGYRIGDEFVAAKTIVWAAGVAASPLAKSLRVPLDRAGRVQVLPDLSVPGHPEIFVAGDLASVSADGKPGSRHRAGGEADGQSRREERFAIGSMGKRRSRFVIAIMAILRRLDVWRRLWICAGFDFQERWRGFSG